MSNSDATMAAIAGRIRARRLEMGYSYQDLADRTGMNKSSLQRYESGGIANVPLHRLEVIAQALEVSPEWLMGWDEEKPRGLKLGSREKEFQSNKGTRLSCKIDSELYNWLAAAADANNRTIEDEIEERLYLTMEADIEDATFQESFKLK